MVMQTLQIRLSKQMIKDIDQRVKTGRYSSRSDAIRDAVRNSFWSAQVGTMRDDGDSVAQVRRIREQLGKNININEINSL